MIICDTRGVPVTAYSLLAGPNHSASPLSVALCFGGLGSLVLLTGIAFALHGAWMVLPFAGLEIVVIAAGVIHVCRHRNDYERVAVSDDALSIERHCGTHTERIELNRHWARVILQCGRGGQGCRLALRSRGRDHEIGRWLDDDQRIAVARDLIRHTGLDPLGRH